MFTLSYDGESVAEVDNEGGLVIAELGGDPLRCVNCEETFARKELADDDECEDAECRVHTGEGNCDDHGCSFPHELEPVPLTWANHASIKLDAERDAITLSISIGEVTGSFAMHVFRNSEGRLIMQVPYEGMTMAHLPFRKLHPGSFAVGEQPEA